MIGPQAQGVGFESISIDFYSDRSVYTDHTPIVGDLEAFMRKLPDYQSEQKAKAVRLVENMGKTLEANVQVACHFIMKK